MIRVRVADKVSPSGVQRATLASADPYFYTHHAHVPLVSLARMFGLLPACTRFPLMVHLQKATAGRLKHLAFHAVLWIYCFLVWLTNASLTVLLTVFLVVTSVEETKMKLDWIVFDLLSCWQSAILSTLLIYCSGNFGWFVSSLDFLLVSFASESFTRNEPTPPLQPKNEQQELVENTVAVPPQRDDIEDAADVADGYVSIMRAWVIGITLVASGLVLTLVSLIIGYRLRDMAPAGDVFNNTKVTGRAVLPLREMVLWASKMAEKECFPQTSDCVGLLAESLQVALGSLAPALFASSAVCLSVLAHSFNKKLRLAEERFLDVDKAIAFHSRFKRLLRRMEKAFAGVIFFIVVGDLAIIVCGTFLGFRQGCQWKSEDSDGICQGYLLRHILTIIQLVIVAIFGSTLNEQMVQVNRILDVFLSHGITSNERLKIIGLLHEVQSSAFSAWGFFKLSRPFVFCMLSLAAVYVSLVLRRSY